MERSQRQKEQRAYELRLEIESDMYELLDNGFTIDEVHEFMVTTADQMREAEQEAEE